MSPPARVSCSAATQLPCRDTKIVSRHSSPMPRTLRAVSQRSLAVSQVVSRGHAVVSQHYFLLYRDPKGRPLSRYKNCIMTHNPFRVHCELCRSSARPYRSSVSCALLPCRNNVSLPPVTIQNFVSRHTLVARLLLTGSEYIHKFITQLPKDYYLIPGNCTIKLVDHIYEWIWIKTPIQIYDSLSKDYYLVPSNETIKLECGFP